MFGKKKIKEDTASDSCECSVAVKEEPVAAVKSAPAAKAAKAAKAAPQSVCDDVQCAVVKPTITRIVVHYDVGFGNSLYLRGQGANLHWDKGVQLKNTSPSEWVWETNLSFTLAEFKVLVNDKVYELGPNHTLKCGAVAQYTPRF